MVEPRWGDTTVSSSECRVLVLFSVVGFSTLPWCRELGFETLELAWLFLKSKGVNKHKWLKGLILV